MVRVVRWGDSYNEDAERGSPCAFPQSRSCRNSLFFYVLCFDSCSHFCLGMPRTRQSTYLWSGERTIILVNRRQTMIRIFWPTSCRSQCLQLILQSLLSVLSFASQSFYFHLHDFSCPLWWPIYARESSAFKVGIYIILNLVLQYQYSSWLTDY